jgi:hypothetical protein
VVALTKGNHDVVSIFSILHNDKLSQNSQYQFVNASLFYCCIQLPSHPITFPSLLDSTMTSYPVSSIFTELNADKLKTLFEKLDNKEFYEIMPKVMNQEELDFLQASTSAVLVTESFMFRKLRGRQDDGSEYPPETTCSHYSGGSHNHATPTTSRQSFWGTVLFILLKTSFVHTGPTTEPNTMCSYVINELDEKLPLVDVGGEMKEVPNNVQGMCAQFELVMQKKKEAAGGKKKRKANDDDDIVVITSDEEMLQKIRVRKLPGFKRHFVSYMKKCRAKNKLEVARELLYQFMERNDVLLPVVVTDYIAEGLEDSNKSELADLFATGWLTPN